MELGGRNGRRGKSSFLGPSTHCDCQPLEKYTCLIQLIHLTIGVPYPLVGFPSGSVVKNLPMQETRVGSFGWEDPLEKEMATLGNPMDRGAWQVTVHGVTKESDVT